jgi:hypothetical protein
MSDDDDPLRGLLRDQITEARNAAGSRWSRHLDPAQTAHLFDAAIAVLVAARGLLAAGEEILRDRQAKVMQTGHDDCEHIKPNDDALAPREGDRVNGNRERIDLTY